MTDQTAETDQNTETETLFEALLMVQGEMPSLAKKGRNPAFGSKYMTLDTIVETVQPILNKYGLVWMAFPTAYEGRATLRYVLQHTASGEKVEDEMPLLNEKNNMQGLGSALTYARRYALCAVLNLVADEDDDGNKASEKPSAAELARAKSRMGDEEKALLAEAEGMRSRVPEEDFKRYVDSTGYTGEGLQRLVNWLKERQA